MTCHNHFVIHIWQIKCHHISYQGFVFLYLLLTVTGRNSPVNRAANSCAEGHQLHLQSTRAKLIVVPTSLDARTRTGWLSARIMRLSGGIRLYFQRHDTPVWLRYKTTIHVHSDKSEPLLIWPSIIVGSKIPIKWHQMMKSITLGHSWLYSSMFILHL